MWNEMLAYSRDKLVQLSNPMSPEENEKKARKLLQYIRRSTVTQVDQVRDFTQSEIDLESSLDTGLSENQHRDFARPPSSLNIGSSKINTRLRWIFAWHPTRTNVEISN